jgi:TonB-linked SusC/RagA family outer membrane protein
MKKIDRISKSERVCYAKMLRLIKPTVFLLLLFGLQLTALSGFSQATRVTLNVKNTTLEDVLTLIEKQSSYVFMYNRQIIDVTKKTEIKVENASIKDALDQLFAKMNIRYRIINKQIVLSPEYAGPEPNKSITGKVTDAQGNAIIGVSVSVRGSGRGVVTDPTGKYTLPDIPENAVLVFSYVGMQKQEIPVAGKAIVDAVMKDGSVGMNEVVVTALGIKKESKSLSYNVQQLSGADAFKVNDANFVNNLNGKVAGVTINSSSAGVGGSSRVVMRGLKSINGNNNALYVIDGIPMMNLASQQPSGVFEGAGQTGDGVSNLNPDDIESISVLAGPAAAALYGSSAANGVVLVTTKKGQKKKTSLDLSNSTTYSSPLILPQFQQTYSQSEQGSYNSWGEKLSTPSSYKPKDFFQTGLNFSNSVSLSTGSDKNQTYLSAGNVNAKGIVHNNDYSRYNFSVRNTSTFLDDKLTLDLGFMNSIVKEQNMISQGQYFNPLVEAYLFPPGDDFSKTQVYERYDASRNFKVQFWPYGDEGLSMQNPYWITERDKFINHKDRYMTNASLTYKVADWINLSGRAKLDKSSERYEKKFAASTNTLFASENGYYSLNEQATRQIYGEFLVNINKYFHHQMFGLTANVGTNIEDVQYDQDLYGGKLQGVPNLYTYSNVNVSTSEASQTGYHKQKQSVFASTQLGYKGMVYLDLTARNDWSSTLANSNIKSFFYPSVGLSGILTDIFSFGSDVMPYWKVRMSYSEVGNEPNVFLTIPTYTVTSGYPQTQTRMPNTNLQPERTKSWEAGMNFAFFKNKLKVDATVYKSNTYNQFFEPTLSASSGYTSVIVNAGRVENKGIEVSARFNDKLGSVGWSSYVTYSLNRNKIIRLLDGWQNPKTGEVISLTEFDMGGTGSYKMMLKEGGSMGDIYVNTLRTDEHGAIYVDPTSQTVVAASNTFIYAGNASPKYNLSWGNQFSWKGISLNALFSARVGGIVVSNTQAILDAFGVSKASADARDAGGALVNGKRIPAKDYYTTIGNVTGGIGSMYTYSATNVRLSELTVGYDLPLRQLKGWVNGVNLSLVGRNLFFLYNKAPYDPEVTANTGTYYQGVDYFMLPSLRSIGFSVKAHF